MNEYTRACRSSRYAGADMKKEGERIVSAYIHKQLKGVKFDKPVSVYFYWYERNLRRDPDNISGFGRKVILDALVRGGVLMDDSMAWVVYLGDYFFIDAKNPRIEVEIEEMT